MATSCAAAIGVGSTRSSSASPATPPESCGAGVPGQSDLRASPCGRPRPAGPRKGGGPRGSSSGARRAARAGSSLGLRHDDLGRPLDLSPRRRDPVCPRLVLAFPVGRLLELTMAGGPADLLVTHTLARGPTEFDQGGEVRFHSDQAWACCTPDPESLLGKTSHSCALGSGGRALGRSRPERGRGRLCGPPLSRPSLRGPRGVRGPAARHHPLRIRGRGGHPRQGGRNRAPRMARGRRRGETGPGARLPKNASGIRRRKVRRHRARRVQAE